MLAAPAAVGAHQPEPIAVERQALDIRFAVIFAAGQAEVSELHFAKVAIAVFAKALQPVETAALITSQPEKPVASGQGG